MDQEASSGRFFISYRRVVSLCHVVHSSIPKWPGDPGVEYETVAQISEQGYYLRRFCLGEHSATHMNAPASFYREGLSIDAYEANSLVVPAVVVDVREQAASSPDYLLSRADLQGWERAFDVIPTRSVVLLHTGWQDRWDRPESFLIRMARAGSISRVLAWRRPAFYWNSVKLPVSASIPMEWMVDKTRPSPLTD